MKRSNKKARSHDELRLASGLRMPRTVQKTLMGRYQNIPKKLVQHNEWFLWRYERKGTQLIKVPFDVSAGHRANTADPSTRSSFERVWEVLQNSSEYHGLGLVLPKDDPVIVIGIDGCIDERGEISEEIQSVITDINSYTERSPSGRGLRIFVAGTKPEGAETVSKVVKGCKKIKIYHPNQFVTVTGKRVVAASQFIKGRQAELENLCDRLWPKHEQDLRTASLVGLADLYDEEFSELAQLAGSVGADTTTLLDQLAAELPGIVYDAIERWVHLHKQGRVPKRVATPCIIPGKEDLPIGRFVRSECNLGIGLKAPTKQFHHAWWKWCESRTIPRTNPQQVGKLLSEACVGVEWRRGTKGPYYGGISLRKPSMMPVVVPVN